MKTRSEPLKTPTSDRYWAFKIHEKGVHHLRHPYYGVAGECLKLVADRGIDPDTDTRSMAAKARDILPVAGLLIGACWWHLTKELDATLPLDGLNEKVLLKYGREVSEELQDADYNLLDIIEMFGKILPRVMDRQSLVKLAEERSAFSAAPEAA